MPIHNYFAFDVFPDQPPRPIPALLIKNGPTIGVKIEISEELENYLSANNKNIPQPITGNALIDTGATTTCVDIETIIKLDISPIGTAQVFTPSGEAVQELFPIRMSFESNKMMFNFNSVLGSELKNQGIIALIGRDLLSKCVLVYNGLMGSYSLSL